MASHYQIRTSAPPEEVRRVFSQVFFTRPKFTARFNPTKTAQLQSNLKWKATTEPDADMAAELVSGGLREAVSDSRNGTGSIIGMRIALALEPGTPTVGQIWLANYRTFLGFNTVGDILKSYSRQVERGLIGTGVTAEVRKL
jgi:hypothetical protein